MKFDPATVAIGLFSFLGETSIAELRTTNDCRGRVFDQIVFIKDIPVEEQAEWYSIALVVTIQSKRHRTDRITRLKV